MIHWHDLCWRSDREPHVLLNKALSKQFHENETAVLLSNLSKANFVLTRSHAAGKNISGQPNKKQEQHILHLRKNSSFIVTYGCK